MKSFPEWFLCWELNKDPNIVSTFIHLLCLAEKEDRICDCGMVRRGQLLISIRQLARCSGIGYEKIRTCLKKLDESAIITQKIRNKSTLITICNYDSYVMSENVDFRNNSAIIPQYEEKTEESAIIPQKIRNKLAPITICDCDSYMVSENADFRNNSAIIPQSKEKEGKEIIRENKEKAERKESTKENKEYKEIKENNKEKEEKENKNFIGLYAHARTYEEVLMEVWNEEYYNVKQTAYIPDWPSHTSSVSFLVSAIRQKMQENGMVVDEKGFGDSARIFFAEAYKVADEWQRRHWDMKTVSSKFQMLYAEIKNPTQKDERRYSCQPRRKPADEDEEWLQKQFTTLFGDINP